MAQIEMKYIIESNLVKSDGKNTLVWMAYPDIEGTYHKVTGFDPLNVFKLLLEAEKEQPTL